MEKLKAVISSYGRWSLLNTYIQRIDAHIETDFSLSLENAKALLETIGKEICTTNGITLNATSSVNNVLKSAFSSLGFSNSSLVNQISSALATIGQQIGELRNEIGLTSHGKTLEEIRQRNEKVDLLTREFLIDTVEMVSIFLIRSFESDNTSTNQQFADTLEYFEAEDFNDSWDESFGEFSMGDYSYAASEILFNVDKQAYVSEYKAFTEKQDD